VPAETTRPLGRAYKSRPPLDQGLSPSFKEHEVVLQFYNSQLHSQFHQVKSPVNMPFVIVICKGENGPQTMDVGCVKQFGLQNGQQAVRVQWLYSPGIEIPMQDYYGEKELFQSKHHDIVPDKSLNGKCDVKYDVADYNDVLRGTPAEDDTWYTRYRCSFSKRADGSVSPKVIPTNVIKVCIREKEMKVGCGRPYNPDRFMLRCSKCDKLFHPECLQIPVSEFTEHSPIGRRCPRPASSVLGIAGLLQGYIQRDDDAHQHWQSA